MGLMALGTVWTGGWPFAALWLAAGIAVAAEWMAMTCPGSARPLTLAASAGLAGLALAHITGVSGTYILAVGAIFGIILGLVAASSRDRGWALAGFVYSAAIVLVPILLRAHPGFGAEAILWMFAVVWTTDIAAYFVGRAIGGPKLWPAVSPGKTWSGFAGGLLGGTLAGCGIVAATAPEGSVLRAGLPAIVAASAIASVASQGGDLAESAMKRLFGVKDSGRLIPGHGGVMDRLDGFAAVTLLVGLAFLTASLAGRAGLS